MLTSSTLCVRSPGPAAWTERCARSGSRVFGVTRASAPRSRPRTAPGRATCVAFIVDVYAQPIVRWHAATKVTDPVLAPVRIAMWDRDRHSHPVNLNAGLPLRCGPSTRIQLVVATPREHGGLRWFVVSKQQTERSARSGRCGHDGLVRDGAHSAEGVLPSAAVAGPFDPGHEAAIRSSSRWARGAC
jgi:hypothetical protein